MDRDDPFPVRITGREVYDAVLLLTGRVDRALTQHDTESKELRRDVDDHEERIRAIERTRWPLPALAVLVSVAAVLANIFVK